MMVDITRIFDRATDSIFTHRPMIFSCHVLFFLKKKKYTYGEYSYDSNKCRLPSNPACTTPSISNSRACPTNLTRHRLQIELAKPLSGCRHWQGIWLVPFGHLQQLVSPWVVVNGGWHTTLDGVQSGYSREYSMYGGLVWSMKYNYIERFDSY